MSRVPSGYAPSRRITADDLLASFDCGAPSLNSFLEHRALRNEAAGHSRTFVVVALEAAKRGHVAGYCALAMGAIGRARMPGSLRRNAPELLPVAIVGRLAVDRRHTGQGIGEDLLIDAMRRIIHASREIGACAILVQALGANAAEFYRNYGFKPTEDEPLTL